MSSAQAQPAYAYASPPAPSSKQRRSPYDRPQSPPNGTADHARVSTPPGRRSPPSSAPAHGHQQQPQHYATYDMPRYQGYMYAPPPPPAPYHPPPHPHPDDHGHAHGYAHSYAPQPFHMTHGPYVPYPLPGTVLSAPQMSHGDAGAGGAGVGGIPRSVRRRCFNCCTTDTSTWRRSNLSPGKVLCNKCGLFERTHSRPRPEQFPHKRGPLAASTLRSRTPPPQTYQNQNQNPPLYPSQSHSAPAHPPPDSHSHSASGSTASDAAAALASHNQTHLHSHPGTPNPNAQYAHTNTPQHSANGQANGSVNEQTSGNGNGNRQGNGNATQSPRRVESPSASREERRGGSPE
ncbi:hypothetical protein B0H13DRAFT_1987695 [Mycena leptocephala]|nr:hypothetical protein B0H13DRAFT_1987695 [Mycena leptocephala]